MSRARHCLPALLIVICLLTPGAGHGAWQQKADLPFNVDAGGALAPRDQYDMWGRIWAICGNSSNGFCYYTASTNSWTDMSATVPEGVVFCGGGCLAFLRGEQGKLLVFTGAVDDPAFIFHKKFILRARGQIGYYPDFWQQFFTPTEDMGDGAALTCEPVSSGPPSEVSNVYAFQGSFEQGFFRTVLAFPTNVGDNDGTIGAYPPEEAVIGTNPVTIDWTNISPCQEYQIQISRNMTFTDLVADVVLTQGEFPSPYLSDGAYFWRLRFKCKTEYLDWTTPVRFYVNTSLPKPAEGAFLATKYPTFLWPSFPQAAGYHVQVASDPCFGNMILDTVLSETSFVREVPVTSSSTPYFWRYGIIDSNSLTQWQPVRRFEVYTASFGRSCFTARKPGAVLDWFPVEGATQYHLQVANDATFSTIILDDLVATSEYILPVVLANAMKLGMHFWRYQYRLGDGPWSGWIDPPGQIPIWESLRLYPQQVDAGGSLAYAHNPANNVWYIYGLSGGDETSLNFYGYDITNSPYDWLEFPPLYNDDVGPYGGASLVWARDFSNGDYIYATLGNYDVTFKRFIQTTCEWEQESQSDVPEEVGDGGALSYINNYNQVYCMVGGDTRSFYVWQLGDNSGAGGGMAGAGAGHADVTLTAGPNPVVGNAVVRYSLPSEGRVNLRILDAQGRLIRQLAHGNQSSGLHELIWNRACGNGRPASAGVYFIELMVGNRNLRQKLIVQ